MATGDTSDIVARLKRLLPQSWFASDGTPVLDACLNGIASPLSWGYSLFLYTITQMRIATATGAWIDRISYDFLGNKTPRRISVDQFTGVVTVIEQDDPYRQRVKAEIMRPRVTRAGVIKAVGDLTGVTPLLYEPWNPDDCGGYGMPCMGYGMAGCWGSLEVTNQFFVTAVRPSGAGIPNVGGYNSGPIGYSEAGELIDLSQISGPVTDADIYKSVSDNEAAGMSGWLDIVSALPPPPETLTTADGLVPTADNGTITADHA